MIGKKIAEIRRLRGYSLSEVAEKTNISKSYLSNLERNLNQNPSLQIIQRIANALAVNLETLLDIKNAQGKTQYIEEEWASFIEELKDLGLKKEGLTEYKTLIEFIKWKNEQHKINEG